MPRLVEFSVWHAGSSEIEVILIIYKLNLLDLHYNVTQNVR
jgi:hypothetical protein